MKGSDESVKMTESILTKNIGDEFYVLLLEADVNKSNGWPYIKARLEYTGINTAKDFTERGLQDWGTPEAPIKGYVHSQKIELLKK